MCCTHVTNLKVMLPLCRVSCVRDLNGCMQGQGVNVLYSDAPKVKSGRDAV